MAIRTVTELLEVEPTTWTSDEAGLIWGYTVAFAEEGLQEAAGVPEPIATESKMRVFGLLLSVAAVILPHAPEGLWTWDQVKPGLLRYNEVVEQRAARSKIHLGREVN